MNLSSVVADYLRIDGVQSGILSQHQGDSEIVAFYPDVEFVDNDPNGRWSKRTLWALTKSDVMCFVANYVWREKGFEYGSVTVDIAEFPLQHLIRCDRQYSLKRSWTERMVKDTVSVTLRFSADSQLGTVSPPAPACRDFLELYQSFCDALAMVNTR